jgi:hypothetical protein
LIGCGRDAPPVPATPPAQPPATASAPAGTATPAATEVEANNATPASAAPDATTAGFETPEAAFMALKSALAARDWRTATACLSAESVQSMTQGMLLAGSLMAAFGGDQAADIQAVMEKHGIDLPEPTISFSVGPDGQPPEQPEPPPAEMPEIADPAGFIADMFAALEKLDQGPAGDQKLEQWTQGELQDLVIDGDAATALIVSKGTDGEQREEIEFRRQASGWLVHLPEEAFAMGPGEQAGSPSPPDDPQPLAEVVLEDGLKSTLDLTFEQPFESQFFGQQFPERTLYVTVSLKGEPVLNAYEYGEFQVTSARDDTGAALELAAPVKDQFSAEFGESFVELNDFFLDVKDTLPIRFALTPPAEGAKSITLEASIKLKVRESIVVENVLDSLGSNLKHERLAELGTFKVSKQNADNGNPDHGLQLEVTGPEGTVEEIELLDGEGQPLKTAGQFSFGFGNQKTFNVDTGEKLPAGTHLRITLGGSETIQVVPLKFEDVALP